MWEHIHQVIVMSNVLTSGVADHFMADYTRNHCPVIIILKFTRPHTPSFKRLIWNYKLHVADYDKLRNLVFESNLSEKIEYEENVDQNIKDITDTILAAAKQSIPNKSVTINPNDQPWITCKIKKNWIRKRKRTFRQFKKTNNNYFWIKYKLLRNKVNAAKRLSRKQYFDKLDHLLSSENCDPKIF